MLLKQVLRNGFTDEKNLMSVTHSASVSPATMFLTKLDLSSAQNCVSLDVTVNASHLLFNMFNVPRIQHSFSSQYVISKYDTKSKHTKVILDAANLD